MAAPDGGMGDGGGGGGAVDGIDHPVRKFAGIVAVGAEDGIGAQAEPGFFPGLAGGHALIVREDEVAAPARDGLDALGVGVVARGERDAVLSVGDDRLGPAEGALGMGVPAGRPGMKALGVAGVGMFAVIRVVHDECAHAFGVGALAQRPGVDALGGGGFGAARGGICFLRRRHGPAPFCWRHSYWPPRGSQGRTPRGWPSEIR